MHEKKCNECQYFRQHYTLDDKKIFRVYCGHCTLDRVRRKLPDSKACKNFILVPPQENAFVSKEYLSKKILEYMLNLELLPEIESKG